MIDLITEKGLPHSLEAERSVLGAIILENEAYDTAAGVITGPDFYAESNRIIWESIESLIEMRSAIDYLTLRNHLTTTGTIDQVGGLSYITSLEQSVPSARHILHYARIVKDSAQKRALIKASYDLIEKTYEGEDSAEKLSEWITSQIAIVAGSQPAKSFADISSDQIAMYERQRLAGGVAGIETGLMDLDRATAGLHDSELIIIAGRPGKGKTALAGTIADHVSKTKNVGIFSIEMHASAIFNRMISKKAQIDSADLHSGRLSGHEWTRAVDAAVVLGERSNSWMCDDPVISINKICSITRQMKQRQGLDLLIIDYLGKIRFTPPKNVMMNRVQIIGEITGRLKALAMELCIPVVCLSQLHRLQSDFIEPELHDLRESGDIEQDADVILFVWDKIIKPKEQGKPGIQEDMITIAKNRNGKTGRVRVKFDKKYTAFYNYMREGAYEPA